MKALFTCQPSSGHWHPLVPLAEALRGAGHDVAFASPPGFAPHVEKGGFHCFRAGADESDEEVQERRKQQDRRTPAERARFMQTYVFAGTRAERSLPDLIDVIGDW